MTVKKTNKIPVLMGITFKLERAQKANTTKVRCVIHYMVVDITEKRRRGGVRGGATIF